MKLSEYIDRYGDKNIAAIETFTVEPELRKLTIESVIVKKTPIDLSVPIESGIDCDFSSKPDFPWSIISTLQAIADRSHPYIQNDTAIEYCRPRMNHIHACPEGFDKCPLPDGFIYKRWFFLKRHNEIRTIEKVTNGDDKTCWRVVTAFKVLGLADGYCYPWETEQ